MNTERFKNAATMTLMEEIVKLHSAYKMVQIGMELKGCTLEEAEKILAEVIKETWEKCDIEFAKVETKTRKDAKDKIDMLESIFGNMEV